MKSAAQMLDELMGSGLSQPKIAELAATSQATVSRIIHDKQNPSYEIGRRIEALYHERIGDRREAS